MKLFFCTNVPSPYRVDFFNELGKYCSLTVLYERHASSERNEKWKGAEVQNHQECYLNLKPIGTDKSFGLDLVRHIRKADFDYLFFSNYVSPSVIIAMIWCKIHNKKYFIEYDGGFNNKLSFFKRITKRYLLCGAVGHFTTSDEHLLSLVSLGIDKQTIFKYPFTSLTENDLLKATSKTHNDKRPLKSKISVKEEKMVLTVGRFSYGKGYGKGYDIIMRLAEQTPDNIGFYIVGDEPTEEFVNWKNEKNLVNVHFVGFKTKEQLSDYYAAADLFVILSRGDVWGLVVNEAMSYGLPIISSSKCIAGLELIKDNYNGYIIDLTDENSIRNKMIDLIQDTEKNKCFGNRSIEIISNYTIEQMAETHIRILNHAF